MKGKIARAVSDWRVVFAVYILLAVAAAFQSYLGSKTYHDGGLVYTKYNNYIIFEKSFEHLKNNQDLYIAYPEEHWDLYKYTPSFAVFFAVFHVLPDWLGLSLWNLLNALVLFFAIYYLPRLSRYHKGLIALIVAIELMTSMQNEQSNALIAGLIVLSFGFLERNKSAWATLCVVFSVFIKLFGLVGFALFLFYPQKWKSALYALLWTGILFLLPLLLVDFEQYMELLGSYLNLLADDHDASYGYSVMGWLHRWFALEVNKNLVLAIGALLFLLPYYKLKLYTDFMFKYLILCSILIWIVIFNHKAESPTFIIAMTGVALWFVQSKKTAINIVLFVGAFIFTSLSPTDLFPKYLREEFVNAYVLKAFPCMLIWVKILYDLLMLKREDSVKVELR